MSVTKIKKKSQKKSSTKGRRKPFSFSKMIFTQKEGFSSGFTTPPEVYTALTKEFHFTARDPATFSRNWGKRVFVNGYVNPEFWVSNALDQIRMKHSTLVVMLLKGDISTSVFHEGIIPYASELYAVRGRLRFGRQKGNAPIGSVIAVFKEGPKIKAFVADKKKEEKKVAKKAEKKIATKSKAKKTQKPKTQRKKKSGLIYPTGLKTDPIPEKKTEEKPDNQVGEKILP